MHVSLVFLAYLSISSCINILTLIIKLSPSSPVVKFICFRFKSLLSGGFVSSVVDVNTKRNEKYSSIMIMSQYISNEIYKSSRVKSNFDFCVFTTFVH